MSGPLARYGSGSVEELFRLGYTRQSTVRQVRLMAHLSRWLASEGIQVAGLTPTVADAFLTARRAAGYAGWLSSRALSPLLTYLRIVVAAPLPAVAAASPTEEMLTRYRSYLISERGLQPSSTRVYAGRVRPFLQQRERPDGQLRLAELAARDVSDFLLTIVRQRGSAKSDVTALRSVLGFLHVQGIIAKPLASAVPSVAGWRLAGLPKALGRGEVQQLLVSCDRTDRVGRRDFAILTLLIRLGLRAGEVAALELDDVDWRRGEIVVRGKGDRHECMPLPVDVGQAIVNYLRDDRPTTDCRRLFLRVLAPHVGMTSRAIAQTVYSAARRAGLPPIGAHRLRHTAATELLRVGASLTEIGQLLRHRRAQSTAIYAKVDREVLRELARAWPGGSMA